MKKYSNSNQQEDYANPAPNIFPEGSGGVKVTQTPEEVVGTILKFMDNVKSSLDNCFNEDGPHFALEIPEYKQGYIDIKKRGGKIRIITEITKNNVYQCQKLEKIVDELRHLDDVEGGIALSDSEYMTTTILDKSKLLTQIVHNDIPEAVIQQQNFYNNLWEKAIPAKQKINDILSELDENQTGVFSTLDNTIRRSMLFYLNEKSFKISQLAKKLDITLQAIHKHSEKLFENGLIEKNSDGLVSLTGIGSALIKQMPSIRFLMENKEFFKIHSMSFLPAKFIQRIGDLQEFEMISGAVKNIEKCQELPEANKFVKFINIPVYLNPGNENFGTPFKNEMNLQYILGEDSIVPRGWGEFTKKIGEKDLISKGFVHRKMAKDLHIMLFVTEKSAALAFPDLQGTPDADNIMYSQDEQFIDWCVDLFDYHWQHSHKFVEEKIHEN